MDDEHIGAVVRCRYAKYRLARQSLCLDKVNHHAGGLIWKDHKAYVDVWFREEEEAVMFTLKWV
jgi:hypothetical protein